MLDLKLIALHDTLEEKIDRVAKEQARIETIVGPKGDDGKDGKDGLQGPQGPAGAPGSDGKDGAKGQDGVDGISVTDASVDLDGHLTITLSNGDEIDAGDLTLFLEKGEDSTHVYVQGNSGSSGSQVATFTSAEALSQHDVCHLDGNGEMEGANATEASTCDSMITLSQGNVESGENGSFLFRGVANVSGFTPGNQLYVSTTSGTISEVSPSSTGQIVRVVGYAISATQIYFDPDKTWIELA